MFSPLVFSVQVGVFMQADVPIKLIPFTGLEFLPGPNDPVVFAGMAVRGCHDSSGEITLIPCDSNCDLKRRSGVKRNTV